MIPVFIKQEFYANTPSKTFEIQISNWIKKKEGRTRPIIFEQTPVEPTKTYYVKKLDK